MARLFSYHSALENNGRFERMNTNEEVLTTEIS